MAYRRFLNDSDYLAILTEEAFSQLIRDVHDRVPQAEQAAEMDIVGYLGQYYEIGRELERGKAMREYTPAVSYPAGAYILLNGKPARVTAPMNGYRKPLDREYWKEIVDFTLISDIDTVPPYLQTRTYNNGNVVRHNGGYWRCVSPNGWDFSNIVVPGIRAWEEVAVAEWEALVDYSEWDVVAYNGNFYALTSKPADYDTSVTPSDGDWWGLVGEYNTEYKFDCADTAHDYAVSGGKVYVPVMNPNADIPQEGVNVVTDDPRNLNLVKHMTRIAVYYLHQTISPTNISETRRLMYEDSMAWLINASKLRVNPLIPRKRKESGEPKDDWATATFQRDFDPYENMWII